MSSILIADDAPIIRSALLRILSQQGSGFGPIWQAENGQEAVALAKQYKPDIILLDIKMPGLNGLQAIDVIRQEQPEAKFVMLTAHNDFSYVQKALKLGVRDYLLKPVRPHKLLELLQEITEEIKAERRDLRTVAMVKDSLQKTLPVIETNLVENLIRGTMYDELTVSDSLSYLGKRLTWPVVLVCKVDGFDRLAQNRSAVELQQIYTTLVETVRGLLPDHRQAIVGYSKPGRIIAIVSSDQALGTAVQVHALGEKIRQTIADTMPFTVTIGVGKRYMEIASIPLSYAEANLARRYYSRLEGNKVVGIDDIQGDLPDQSEPSFYLVEKERELVRAVQTNQQQQGQRLVNDIVDYLSQQYSSVPEAIKNHCAEMVTLIAWGIIDIGASEAKTLSVLHQQIRALALQHSGSEIRTWALNSLAEMLTLVQSLSDRPDAVQQAIAYMQRHYDQADISLQTVAEAVNLSPSYLSTQLKERVGLSYSKHLTRVRLEEAKKLLRTTDQSVTAVAEAVGYPHVTNFYRHFQSQLKMTPAAYREADR
jgi:two-component system, response regulator YesN